MAKGWLPCRERIFCGRWHQQYNDPTHNRFFLCPPITVSLCQSLTSSAPLCSEVFRGIPPRSLADPATYRVNKRKRRWESKSRFLSKVVTDFSGCVSPPLLPRDCSQPPGRARSDPAVRGCQLGPFWPGGDLVPGRVELSLHGSHLSLCHKDTAEGRKGSSGWLELWLYGKRELV